MGLAAARGAREPHRNEADDSQHQEDRLQDVEGRRDADDEEEAARETDRRPGDSHHPAHRVHRSAQQVLELGGLEALQVDRDDPIEQDRVRVSLDDRGEHRLLLALYEPGRARDQAQTDHLAEQRPDAPEIASAARRENCGDEVSRDHELRARRDRGHDLRREAREESPGRRFPHKPERRTQNARDSTELAPLGRSLDAIAAPPEDQGGGGMRFPRTSTCVPFWVWTIRRITVEHAVQRSTIPGAWTYAMSPPM